MELKIREANINYEIIGSGRSIIMINGWGCNPTGALSFSDALRGTPRALRVGAVLIALSI